MSNEDVPIEEMHECYTIHQYDRDTLEEVQHCIDEGFYDSKGKVEDHLDVVTDIENKMGYIIKLESQVGHAVMSFVAFRDQARRIHEQLVQIRQRLEAEDAPQPLPDKSEESPGREHPMHFFKH